MADVNIDTEKMKECGKDIMALSAEIGDEFNYIFDKIINMPTITLEWTGDSALAYANKIKHDKVRYIEFKKQLYEYGKALVDYANVLEIQISKLGD